MRDSQKHGLCKRCLTPLREVDSYDMDAAMRGETVRIKRLECPECVHEMLGQLLDIIIADDPQMREMFALLEQGVSVDDLPVHLLGEEEANLARLFSFLDDEPDGSPRGAEHED